MRFHHQTAPPVRIVGNPPAGRPVVCWTHARQTGTGFNYDVLVTTNTRNEPPVKRERDSIWLKGQSWHPRTWTGAHSSIEDGPFTMEAEDDWNRGQYRGRTEYNGRLTPERNDLNVGRVLAGARGMMCDNAPMCLYSADTSTHPHSKVTRRGRLTY